jgi:hypothetical protein
MNMLAEIFTAEHDWSDVFLLVAVILFIVAALGNWHAEVGKFSTVLTAIGLAFTAFALMLL